MYSVWSCLTPLLVDAAKVSFDCEISLKTICKIFNSRHCELVELHEMLWNHFSRTRCNWRWVYECLVLGDTRDRVLWAKLSQRNDYQQLLWLHYNCQAVQHVKRSTSDWHIHCQQPAGNSQWRDTQPPDVWADSALPSLWHSQPPRNWHFSGCDLWRTHSTQWHNQWLLQWPWHDYLAWH